MTKTPLPILYSFRRCPYAMRARLALHYTEIRYQHREILLKDKPDALLACSPKGTVPVLYRSEQVILEESLDIMYWALEQQDPEHWLPNTTEQIDQIKQLIHHNDTVFAPLLTRYKYPDRYLNADDTLADAQINFRQQATAQLKQLTTNLSQQTGLCTDQLCLADYAIVPFVRQFSLVDPDWFREQVPEAQSWLQAICESNRFQAIMRKYPIWSGEADVLILPDDEAKGIAA